MVLVILSSLWGFFSAIRPTHKILSTLTPIQLNVPYEDISFRTKDHVLIRGWFIPSTRPHAKTIILLHGYPADKGNILSTRLFLHDEFNLLFFDFRFLGHSEGKYISFGKNEILDLNAAVDYLQNRGIKEVGVWGLSMGGAVALLGANIPQVKAIVAESSYASLDKMLSTYYSVPGLQYPLANLTRVWGKLFLHMDINDISPVNVVTHLKKPLLIIHSQSDNQIPFDHALQLQAASRANPHAQFLFVDRLSHGQITPRETKQIKTFFEKNL